MIYSTNDDVNHTLFECSQEESREFRNEVICFRDKLRRSKSIASYSCCFYCFLPHIYCRRWRDNGKGRFLNIPGVKECSYPDFTLFYLIVGLSIPGYLSGYIDRLKDEGIDRGSEEEYRFLGRKEDFSDLETNNLFIELGFLAKETELYREEKEVL